MCPTTFKQTILVSNPPDILFSEFFKGLKESFLKQPPAQTKSCVVSLQFSKLDHPRDTGNVEETSESLEVDAETDVNDSDNTKMQIFADYEYQSLLNHFENLTSLITLFLDQCSQKQNGAISAAVLVSPAQVQMYAAVYSAEQQNQKACYVIM